MVVVGKKGGDDVVRTPVTACHLWRLFANLPGVSLLFLHQHPAGTDSGPACVSAQSTHAVGVVYRTSQASFLDREASK